MYVKQQMVLKDRIYNFQEKIPILNYFVTATNLFWSTQVRLCLEDEGKSGVLKRMKDDLSQVVQYDGTDILTICRR